MKTQTIVIIIVAVALVGAGVWYFMSQKEITKTESAETSQVPSTPVNAPSSVVNALKKAIGSGKYHSATAGIGKMTASKGGVGMGAGAGAI